MRVLSLSYCFPNAAQPSWGVFVAQRLAALSKRIDLEVAAPQACFPLLRPPARHDEGDGCMGLNVHRPPFYFVPAILKNLDGGLYARSLRKWMECYCCRRRPDLLDAHFIWPDGVGVGLLARRMGLPYVITLRGKIYDCLTSRSQTRQCGDALVGAAAVISVSGDMAHIAAQWGVPSEKIFVMPNGVDRQAFCLRDRLSCRRQLNLPQDKHIVLCVGHLKRTKGQAELLWSLRQLSANVHAVLVGGEATRGYRRQLDDWIRRLGLRDRVTLAGRQSYDRIPLYFNAADVSVLASHREGCPNVVLESLASGTPVVATDVGAVRDLMVPGRDGEIIPPRDFRLLAQALERVLSKTWQGELLRQSPAVRSWDDVAADVHAVFQRVVNGTMALSSARPQEMAQADYNKPRERSFISESVRGRYVNRNVMS